MELTPKQKYKLAHSIERGESLIQAHNAYTSYDRYCEITSYTDGTYEENAEYVDMEYDRTAYACHCASALIEQYKPLIEDKYFNEVRQIPRRYEPDIEPFCLFNRLVSGRRTMLGGYPRHGRRSTITEALWYRHHYGSWAEAGRYVFQRIEPTKLRRYEPDQQFLEYLRGEFSQRYNRTTQ